MSPEERTGRLFRTLVLMGSSVALGCGSASDNDESPPNSGGSANLGGAPANTGGATGDTGGAPSTGGRPPIEPGPFDCDPAQLACETTWLGCGYNEHLDEGGGHLPDGCSCDADKPLGADECGEGETFLCEQAVLDAQGAPLDRVVHFDCRCVANETNCFEACATGQCLGPHGGAVSDAPAPALCACALPVLR